MRATYVLAEQHQAIAALFDSVEHSVDADACEQAVERLAEELIAHMAGEETVFYPAVRRILGRTVALDERLLAGDEHVTLKIELRRVLARSPEEAAFAEAMVALRTMFERHVREEETRLFPRVERALADADQQVLGAEIVASRPPLWMVVPERSAPRHAGGTRTVELGTGVSLPIPAARS